MNMRIKFFIYFFLLLFPVLLINCEILFSALSNGDDSVNLYCLSNDKVICYHYMEDHNDGSQYTCKENFKEVEKCSTKNLLYICDIEEDELSTYYFTYKSQLENPRACPILC